MEAKIFEKGNGFPGVGDVLMAGDGSFYELIDTNGVIHTDRPTEGNYIYAEVISADDPGERGNFQAAIELGGDDEE